MTGPPPLFLRISLAGFSVAVESLAREILPKWNKF
jgi:hypothetical protein